MNYIFICIIILLLIVIVYLLIYKKRPIIIRNYKEFTLENISYKADIINNFYSVACNKIMRFQADSLHLKRDEDTGKYIIKLIFQFGYRFLQLIMIILLQNILK